MKTPFSGVASTLSTFLNTTTDRHVSWARVRLKLNMILQPDEFIDVIIFGALPQDLLRYMIDNHYAPTPGTPLRRGKRFAEYQQGKMVQVGSINPAGGEPGSAYSSAKGWDADMINGVKNVFREATVDNNVKFLLSLTQVCTGRLHNDGNCAGLPPGRRHCH